MKARPGVQRGFDAAKELRQASASGPDEQAKKILFGQTANR